ncbi:MAG: hypothetical protein A2X94_12855 [Bdellovibrionales bacterium GWB1_55_8]|nr:MAG: hypothetical protein A2X94_12855 [Bdellovibrionales bacterium GWB1_55_8]
MDSIGESLAEQQWFQELRGKWDELDTQSRLYLKLGSLAASLLLVIGLVLGSVVHVYRIKKEYTTKSDLLTLISSANDELRLLRDANRGISAPSAAGPWPEYLQSAATSAGIDPAKVTVSAEKPGKPPAAGRDKEDVAVKEALFEVSIKRLNVRQLVRYAYQLENGTRPVKIRHMGIEAEKNLSGYLDAKVAVSAFSVASK